jgi:hypothetical protein
VATFARLPRDRKFTKVSFRGARGPALAELPYISFSRNDTDFGGIICDPGRDVLLTLQDIEVLRSGSGSLNTADINQIASQAEPAVLRLTRHFCALMDGKSERASGQKTLKRSVSILLHLPLVPVISLFIYI